MASPDFRPLRVRAYLRTPVVADRWLPLDGVLLYQAARQALGAQESTIPGGIINEHKVNDLRLPIWRERDRQKDWYYRCSWAQWATPAVEARDFWNKRFDNGFADLIDFQGRRGRVIIEQNTYKAYHMPVYYRAALYVDWYCYGIEAQLRELLATITHLGKKTVQGWGRVMRWEIEATPADWSVWKEGTLMRGVPADGAPVEYNRALYGIRPSYWRRENQMELAMPK